jgi:hypothetical protein
LTEDARPVTGWDSLEAELDAWAKAGRRPEFWWRDDDAEAPSDELDRLLSIRRDAAVPLAIAVIPASAHAGLRGALEPESDITVLQHGYDHANNAVGHAKKEELCVGRSRVRVIAQLTEGAMRLKALFGGGFSTILVPPWNRIDAALVPVLPQAGFLGLSAFAGRNAPADVPGLGRADCHIDIIDWHGGRRFVGIETVLDQAIGVLSSARGRLDRPSADVSQRVAEPVGLLTHHRDMDEACWDFVREFLRRTGAGGEAMERGRGRWISVSDALCFGR